MSPTVQTSSTSRFMYAARHPRGAASAWVSARISFRCFAERAAWPKFTTKRSGTDLSLRSFPVHNGGPLCGGTVWRPSMILEEGQSVNPNSFSTHQKNASSYVISYGNGRDYLSQDGESRNCGELPERSTAGFSNPFRGEKLPNRAGWQARSIIKP